MQSAPHVFTGSSVRGRAPQDCRRQLRKGGGRLEQIGSPSPRTHDGQCLREASHASDENQNERAPASIDLWSHVHIVLLCFLLCRVLELPPTQEVAQELMDGHGLTETSVRRLPPLAISEPPSHGESRRPQRFVKGIQRLSLCRGNRTHVRPLAGRESPTRDATTVDS